jgi:hypothetical protein
MGQLPGAIFGAMPNFGAMGPFAPKLEIQPKLRAR